MFTSSFFNRTVPSSQDHLKDSSSTTSSPRTSVSTQSSDMSPITPRSTSSSDDSIDSAIQQQLQDIQIRPSESQQKIDKARKAGKYLKLLVHCQTCRGSCNTAICKSTRLLLNHCAPCQKRESCPIKGCFQTKKLLCHMIACRFERKNAKKTGGSKECLICAALDDGNNDTVSDSGDSRQPSFDMDGFSKPTALPRRFRSSDPSGSRPGDSLYCRSQSVQEESDEMEEDDDSGGRHAFCHRYTSI